MTLGKNGLRFISQGMAKTKKKATCLKMPLSTVRAILKFKATETVWKRIHVYFSPTHSEGDDKRGKKIPQDHCWRITKESSILVSSSPQNYH